MKRQYSNKGKDKQINVIDNMKKLFLLSVAALVTFAACQKEINPAKQEAGITALTATVEQQVGDTKTALGNSNSVVWSEGDVIKVWNASNESGDFTLIEGAGTTQGTFNGNEITDPLYAFYPASAVSSVEGSVATFTLPATQHYVKNTFDNGANIAVAQISGNSMQFKNVCGVLKLQLKGTTIVKSIVVTGKNNEKLNGTYTVDASTPTPDMPCATTETESEKSVTLDCGDGVLLDPTTLTNFYIVLPSDSFGSGFNVTVLDRSLLKETIPASGNRINRNVILTMPGRALNLKGNVLPGIFSISETKKVKFATGNLNATITDSGVPTSWQFAATQYSVLESGGANLTIGTVGGDIDRFSFSTDGTGAGSGYKPWGINASTNNNDFAGNFVSWTENPDVKNTVGQYWRLLNKDEFTYLTKTRNHTLGQASSVGDSEDARTTLIGIQPASLGMLIFPDTFVWDETSMGIVPSYINGGNSDWAWSHLYTKEQFAAMEAAGCVFLPLTRERNGTSYTGTQGYYTLDSRDGHYHRCKVGSVPSVSTADDWKFVGVSVRFICDVDL